MLVVTYATGLEATTTAMFELVLLSTGLTAVAVQLDKVEVCELKPKVLAIDEFEDKLATE